MEVEMVVKRFPSKSVDIAFVLKLLNGTEAQCVRQIQNH